MAYVLHAKIQRYTLPTIPSTFMKHQVELVICQLQNGCRGEQKAKQYVGLNTSGLRVSCTATGILQCGITTRASPPGDNGDAMWLANVEAL